MTDYCSAGVDTHKAAQFIRQIAPMIRRTKRVGADAEVGGFGGLFDLKACGYGDPVLVAATDGVGTKLRLATEAGKHDTVGIDLVAMCANDLIVQGAEPLFFLDYLAQGSLPSAEVFHDIFAGIVEGCMRAGCALIGGETAEMPGMYSKGDYDLAGFSLGAVERDALVSAANVQEGDILLGLPSSGFHSNGFSLIRKIVQGRDLHAPAPFDPNQSLASALLTPTRIYVKDLLPLCRNIRGMWHITGGGFYENLERGLDPSLCSSIDRPWHIPACFTWLAETGDISAQEMLSTFNCGIGMVLAVKSDEPEYAETIRASLDAVELGKIIPNTHDRQVLISEDCLRALKA